jgi:DNA-binding HxlR family transcriptional regulator
MKESQIAEGFCSVAKTIGTIGDAWTLLLLRELFLGTRRFEDFQAYTGMAPKLLSSRLSKLEREGIIKKVPYQERPVRYEARLTPKGLDLYPIIVSMAHWSNRWKLDPNGERPIQLTHRVCGKPFEPFLGCESCGQSVSARDVQLEMSETLRAERNEMHERFHKAVKRKSSPTAS